MAEATQVIRVGKRVRIVRGRIDWVKEAHLLGTMRDEDLARELGVSKGTVFKERRSRGIPAFTRSKHGRFHRTRESRKKAIALRGLGMTFKEIGLRMNISWQMARYLVQPESIVHAKRNEGRES